MSGSPPGSVEQRMRQHSTRQPRLTTFCRRGTAVLATLSISAAVAACGSSSSSSSSSAASGSGSVSSTAKPASGQVPLSANQTVVWAIEGGVSNAFGSEALASKNEIAAFEKLYPNIKVQVVALSEDADTARATIDRDFLAGSSTPDVIDASTDWIGEMAHAGFIAPLTSLGLTGFLPGAAVATSLNGTLYGALWYYNAEGLYYNKALIKTPPKTPTELVADAAAAMKADPKLKEGLAFEGDKYEGFVTVFIDFLRAFGGSFNPADFNTPQNLAALQYLHDLVYKYKVSNTAAAGWQETQVDNAFQSGQTAFATNWPYVQQEDFNKSKTYPLSGKNEVGFVPFPTQNGTGTSTVAGDALIVNAKSKNLAAVHALIKFILQPTVQQARAVTSGDPPSVAAAYTPALFKKAPYFQDDLNVFKAGYPRLVNARYSQISSYVQDMLSSVLANQQSPADALKTAAAQIAPLAS
jgi:multiple sugar transport system substrate-binding protein